MDIWGAAFFLTGVALGIVSGLLPGLHANTLIPVIAGSGLEPEMIAILIISLFPANMIISFIPSIFLSVPEEGTVIAVLPGHRMVMEGRGIAALKVVLLSGAFAALVGAALFFLTLDIFPLAYGAVQGVMKYIVLALSAFLLIRTKRPQLSLLVFVLSGMLGFYSLNSGMGDPFLPLFSGMFAMGSILTYGRSKMPEQKDEKAGLSFLKYSLAGVLLGMFADLVPGISSPSQVATFAAMFMPMNTLGYLAALGSISMSEALFTLSTSVSIGKARMGATAWLGEYMDIGENLPFLVGLFIMSTAISVLLAYLLRKHIVKLASVDFSKINVVLACYLACLVLLLDGFSGIAVFALASALGWVTVRMGVERTNLMGAVILPTLLLLFGIFL